jgi:hypothetical protein
MISNLMIGGMMNKVLVLLSLLVSFSGHGIVVNPIVNNYCVDSDQFSKKELVLNMASSLLDFSSYKEFDEGFVQKFLFDTMSISPLNMNDSALKVQQDNFNADHEFDKTSLIAFVIQPMPSYDVAASGYTRMILQCRSNVINGGESFTYECRLNKGDGNFGVDRFDTKLTVSTVSSICSRGVELNIEGNIEVNDADYAHIQSEIVKGISHSQTASQIKIPQKIQDLLFDVQVLFTEYYQYFYQGWISKSGYRVLKSW